MNYNLRNDASILDIGTKLDNNRYKIIDILGKGGFGIVYKVKRLSDLREFAIKELFIRSDNDICFRSRDNNKIFSKNSKLFNIFKERVKKEVEFLSKNNNENIIYIYSYFEDNNTIYTVMEYINGYDLEKLIIDRKKIFTENEVLELLIQLANGFKKIHNQNVIHRDIKPNNIIRTKDKIYKLIDFTNIKMFLEEDRGTITKLRLKAEFFSPPELITETDTEIGIYSDIYSLGMTIYCCFSGNFQAPNASQRQINDSFYKQVDDLDISNKYKSLIKKMTKLDKNDRFQSLDEVLEYIIKEPWYKRLFKFIKDFFINLSNSFSLPKISLSLPNLNVILFKKNFENLSKIIPILSKVFGAILIILFISYLFFTPPPVPCGTEEEMYICEQRYREIAFDTNPKISNLNEFEKLVKAGVHINQIKNKYGETALNHLSFKGKYEFVKILVDNGIDVNIQDNNGEIALYEAIVYASRYEDYNKNIINLLIDNGTDISLRRNDGKSILLGAINANNECKNNLKDIIQKLVDKDACKYENIKYYDNKSILKLPNSKKYSDTYKILKKGGC